jgi:hypothetical protein
MTKIVILGSCRFAPYEILTTPNKIPNAWNTEEGYKKAAEKFYPAIAQADMVLVYAPDGIGEHTARDILEAHRQGKELFLIVPFKVGTTVHGDADQLAKTALFKLGKEKLFEENEEHA